MHSHFQLRRYLIPVAEYHSFRDAAFRVWMLLASESPSDLATINAQTHTHFKNLTVPSRRLDVHDKGKTITSCRRRPRDGLHAEAMGELQPLPDGRPHLSKQQFCGTDASSRRVAIGREAWLFAGSDRGGERVAAMYSLIVTARLNDVGPRAWFADVLRRIGDHPVARLQELLPWNWRSETQAVSAA
jgi:hypothetical protein